MGHERVGHLPKTHQWRQIVAQLGSLYTSDVQVSQIAGETIQKVRERFRGLQRDGGVQAAFQFLVTLSVASRSSDPKGELSAAGIQVPQAVTPLSLARSLHTWVEARAHSLEYGEIAKAAATDAIAIWHDQHKPSQARLFEALSDPYEVWRKSGSGAGFCELSRLFFGKLTERYLNYFLEREASSVMDSAPGRDRFREQLREHVDQVSQHAFETARITQSFAAGWFNRNASQGVPSLQSIENFLSVAFGKIRDELERAGRS